MRSNSVMEVIEVINLVFLMKVYIKYDKKCLLVATIECNGKRQPP